MSSVDTRVFLFLAALLPLWAAGCAGRSVNRSSARELIAEIDSGALGKESVTVDSVTRAAGDSMVVEARVRAAFRLDKTKGSWEVREIRVGDREWEDVDVLLEAIQRAKAARTIASIEAVMDAIETYRRKNGALPAFRDYVSLADTLHPEFLNPLIRLDAWQHPLAALRVADDAVRLTSAGGDGKPGTADDIEVLRRFR